MIEVKSVWTYNKKIDNIEQKANQCIKEGYGYEIWVYNHKHEKIIKIT
jgi:hypothetical protein